MPWLQRSSCVLTHPRHTTSHHVTPRHSTSLHVTPRHSTFPLPHLTLSIPHLPPSTQSTPSTPCTPAPTYSLHSAHSLPHLTPSTPPMPIRLDCEMVGTGRDGKSSILARVSIVNRYGSFDIIWGLIRQYLGAVSILFWGHLPLTGPSARSTPPACAVRCALLGGYAVCAACAACTVCAVCAVCAVCRALLGGYAYWVLADACDPML